MPQKSLTIVIPLFNEAATLARIVERVLSADTLGLNVDIILVDDGSRDGSPQIASEIVETEPRVSLLTHARNRGKGAAVRTGFEAATGDIVLIQDADLEYDPVDYPKLLGPFLEDDADVVYGTRLRGGELMRLIYFWHSVGNRLLTLFSNMFTGLNFSDMETCYKVFRREVLSQIQLKENRFGIEPEITAKICRIRPPIRIFEVSVSYRGRTYADGKKIDWKDGVAAIYYILRYNLFD